MQSYQDWLSNMFKAIHNTERGQFLALPNKEGEYVHESYILCSDF